MCWVSANQGFLNTSSAFTYKDIVTTTDEKLRSLKGLTGMSDPVTTSNNK